MLLLGKYTTNYKSVLLVIQKTNVGPTDIYSLGATTGVTTTMLTNGI